LEDRLSLFEDNIISYWLELKDKLPVLARMALSFIGSPSASTFSERVFSYVTLISNGLRSNIDIDTINKRSFVYFMNKPKDTQRDMENPYRVDVPDLPIENDLNDDFDNSSKLYVVDDDRMEMGDEVEITIEQ